MISPSLTMVHLTGDDCISIGSGSLNVDIRYITCGPGHGISNGSLGNHNSHACAKNITVSRSKIRHVDNGVRIKTWQGGSGSVSSITFEDMHMDTGHIRCLKPTQTPCLQQLNSMYQLNSSRGGASTVKRSPLLECIRTLRNTHNSSNLMLIQGPATFDYS
ncbi:polygalacturonase-like protein [Cinnamomum micranthum f. kanehirae]|uniref:Polygalacturonase-like protein n=1 Tax=Cinnamomum micranthum f. kanehirae TaxID=337451 RepID=A0A3S3R2U5_9MAGN|nr:polygalacturonase-like protein [Cinnamomum micranthum f. kanehirae]